MRSELWFISASVVRKKQYALVAGVHGTMPRAMQKPGREQRAKAAEPKLTWILRTSERGLAAPGRSGSYSSLQRKGSPSDIMIEIMKH